MNEDHFEESSPVIASRDGVTVEKSVGSDDFPIPTIAFVITSEREEPVDVRFVDPVPDDVAIEGVGFHPKYGSEHWHIEDGDIVFERSIGSGEEITTIYGLRSEDLVDPDRIMSEPIIEQVDPSYADSAEAMLAGDTASPNGSGGATDEAIAGTDRERDIEFVDPLEGSRSDGARNGSASIAKRLAQEARDDEIDERDLETLRSALEPGTLDGSVEARLKHLQTRMTDFDAYVDALEEFLDENGDAATLLSDFRMNVRELETELEAYWEDLDIAQAAIADLEAEQERLDERIERLEDDLDDVDELHREFDALAEEVDRLDDQLAELSKMRERLSDVFVDPGSDGDRE